MGGVLLVITLALLYYIRNRRRYFNKIGIESKQNSEIPYSEISFGTKIGRGASGEVFKATWRGTEVCGPK